jgi:hypothetical protein
MTFIPHAARHTRHSLLLTTALAACCGTAAAPPTTTATDNLLAELTLMTDMLAKAVDLAERKCLINETKTSSAGVGASLRALLIDLRGSATVEAKTEVLRGARAGFDQAQTLAETAKLHNCMDQVVLPFLTLINAQSVVPLSAAAWPDPITFRFNFLKRLEVSAKLYSGLVRLEVTANKKYSSVRLASQDPQGQNYFFDKIAFPAPGESARGTIVAERAGDAILSNQPPAIADLCFRPANKLPKLGEIDYDWFDCMEGKQCKPSAHATGWLQACPATAPATAQTRSILADFLLPPAYAVTAPPVASGARNTAYWLEPSLLALSERKNQGVGYTMFSIQTEAFRAPNINGVEVNIRVNGVPVLEDGLLPEQRVVANDPGHAFNHSFALQTLDFQGANGGCDRIELGLRPRLDDGSKGKAQTLTLSYVALRDVAPRTQKLGDFPLRWRASYMTPEREWRHIAELHSYVFRASDAAARQRSVEQAEQGKQWLDGQAYTYQGKKIVGVIRPPRTVKPDGTAAFGLGTGLIQENGQIRFTFSEAEARALAAFMIAKRPDSQMAARTVHSEPYIFQSSSGSYTAPGICEN